MMRPDTKHIASLIARSKVGGLSGSEQRELDTWRVASPRHEAIYRRCLDPGFEASMERLYTPGEEKALYVSLRRKLFPARRMWQRWACAGAAAACLLVGWLWTRTPSIPPADSPQLALSNIVPVGRQALLYAGFGTTYDSALPAGDTVVAAYPLDSPAAYSCELPVPLPVALPAMRPDDLRRVVVPRGGEYRLALPDGTCIHLNSQSDLRLMALSESDGRRVAFRGEAYFQVAHTPDDSPFVIATALGTVEVLGTSFNLRCHDGSRVLTLALEEGKVRFRTPGEGQEATVMPGQLLTYDADVGRLDVAEADTRLYTSWCEGIYSFRQTPLSVIMDDLSRWYDIPIVFADEELKTKTFTGEVKRYGSFLEVARMFELTKMVHFCVEGEKVVVEP